LLYLYRIINLDLLNMRVSEVCRIAKNIDKIYVCSKFECACLWRCSCLIQYDVLTTFNRLPEPPSFLFRKERPVSRGFAMQWTSVVHSIAWVKVVKSLKVQRATFTWRWSKLPCRRNWCYGTAKFIAATTEHLSPDLPWASSSLCGVKSRKNQEPMGLLASPCPNASYFRCNNSRTADRILMPFDIWKIW
jgi:hypothetical protein